MSQPCPLIFSAAGQLHYCRFIDDQVTERTCQLCQGNYAPLAAQRAQVKKDHKEAVMVNSLGQATGCRGCGHELRLIAQGFGALIAEAVLGRQPPKWVLQRAQVCAACDYRTFLSVVEWTEAQARNLLSEDKMLPINHQPGRFDRLWCAACTCYLEAAIRARDKACPIKKWNSAPEE